MPLIAAREPLAQVLVVVGAPRLVGARAELLVAPGAQPGGGVGRGQDRRQQDSGSVATKENKGT